MGKFGYSEELWEIMYIICIYVYMCVYVNIIILSYVMKNHILGYHTSHNWKIEILYLLSGINYNQKQSLHCSGILYLFSMSKTRSERNLQ